MVTNPKSVKYQIQNIKYTKCCMLGLNMFISTISVLKVLCENGLSLLMLINLLEIPKVTDPLPGPP